MSIRGRLLTLAVGGVLPLLIVSLSVLWVVWSEKRNQLNESLEQQGELVGVVFDRWLDAQYQPLRTIASYPSDHLKDPETLKANLQAVMIPRASWIDIRSTSGFSRSSSASIVISKSSGVAANRTGCTTSPSARQTTCTTRTSVSG